MKDEAKHTRPLSRRKALSLLGIGLMVPGYGSGSSNNKSNTIADCEKDQILLTADGKPVKLKSKLNSVKLLEKRISNKGLFNWLNDVTFKNSDR